MDDTGFALPADVALDAALRQLFVAAHPGTDGVALVARRRNAYMSSSPSEVVTLRLAADELRDFIVKYDREAKDPPPTCRHGVEYCAAVYAHLVSGMPLPHLRAVGTFQAGAHGRQALVIEYLDHSLRVGEAPEVSGILTAAEWCGAFHRWSQTVRDDARLAFVVRYDEAFYSSWADRLIAVCAAAGLQPTWLASLRTAARAMSHDLAAATTTVIHGEMSPQNVLWREGEIFPIDWESAAVGPGEIDLAALLFGWPPETVERCIAAYWQARNMPVPDGFARRWQAATLYTALRWLPLPIGPANPRFDLALDRVGTLVTGPGSG